MEILVFGGFDWVSGFVDMYLGFEEIDAGDDEASRAEYACPFCGEDFDIVGLCCHIDEEHPIEARTGVLNSIQ